LAAATSPPPGSLTRRPDSQRPIWRSKRWASVAGEIGAGKSDGATEAT
jgi:hypothetical protein